MTGTTRNILRFALICILCIAVITALVVAVEWFNA